MVSGNAKFEQSVLRQIAINQARTPTERMEAFFELMDAVRDMSPTDPEAIERRKKAMELRKKNHEVLRATFRRLIATGKLDPAPSARSVD